MSVVVTKILDLAPEFSTVFRGHTPGPSQQEGATPCRTHPQPGLWPSTGHGRKRLGVRTQTWSPALFNRGCAPENGFQAKQP